MGALFYLAFSYILRVRVQAMGVFTTGRVARTVFFKVPFFSEVWSSSCWKRDKKKGTVPPPPKHASVGLRSGRGIGRFGEEQAEPHATC